MDLLISAINAADLGWKANTCKLQKTHIDYGKGQKCGLNGLEDSNLVQLESDQKESFSKDDLLGELMNFNKEKPKAKEFGLA